MIGIPIAPHEFGHLLGAPDEYKKAGTTQLGVKDGVDTSSIMGSGGPVKKRSYRGILLAMARCAKSVSTRDFSYIAVPTGPTLALDPSMPKLPDQGPSPAIQQMIEPESKPVVNVAAVAGSILIFTAVGTALGYFAAVRSRPVHGSKPLLPIAVTIFIVQ